MIVETVNKSLLIDRCRCASALAVSIAFFLSPSPAWSMDTAVSRLAQVLEEEVPCETGAEALVGIFPFDEANLPLAPQNAFRLYEAFLGALLESAPQCVRFIDGRGAFVTLGYLGQTGTLRESGQQQREQIQASLSSADFMLDGTVLESDGTLSVTFRLTALASGIAIGRESFDLPEAYRSSACGDGALPEDVAIRRIAAALLNRAGPVVQVIASGGRYANSDAVTDAGRYLEEQLIAQLSRASENLITGSSLSVRRSVEEEVDGLLDEETYALILRYWPCEGDRTARLSVTLRSHDWRDVTEIVNISLGSMPAGLQLRPQFRPSITGELMVYPLSATVGTEVSLLAAPPAYCDPFFFNIAPSGRLTPIPLDFFRQLDLGGGRIRYEISPQWDFGLMVQEDDEVGLNHLGYLCQPAEAQDMTELRRLLVELLERRENYAEGVIEIPGLSPAYFQLGGFEIFF